MRAFGVVLAASVLTVVVLAAALSLVWTPYDISRLDVSRAFAKPDVDHWLGADHYGRDTLSMLMIGARTSIAVAFFAVVIGAAIGIPLGSLAAARRGWLDEIVMRGNDLIFAFPALLSALMIAAAFGRGATVAIVAIAVFNIPVFARVTRGASLPIWRAEYVTAARAAGRGEVGIVADHILPNIAAVLIVQATIQFSVAILQEAGLSYVGLGARPPLTSWGQMLSEAQTMAAIAPRLALLPGLSIMVTVLALNTLGNRLRDALDPRLGRELDAL